MADRKTVMSWLEGLAQDDWHEWHSDSEVQTTAQAVLELLKAQEPVRPKYIDGKRNHFIMCGKCNTDLIRGMKYCSYCGQEVKWE